MVTDLQEEEVAVVRYFYLDWPIPVLGGVTDQFRHRQEHGISIDP